MKGQRLFVRIATAEDHSDLIEFYAKEESSTPVPLDVGAPAVLGKLVGDLVAHLAYSRTGEAVRVEHIHVARLLRRKRVGRLMISELARMSGRDGATRIEALPSCGAADFLRAIGFEQSSSDAMLSIDIEPEEES